MIIFKLEWHLVYTDRYCKGGYTDKGYKRSIFSCAVACRDSPYFIYGTHEYGASGVCSSSWEGACKCYCQAGVNGKCPKVSSKKYNVFKLD